MTRDEIQKLIGGYATGTLTDSERKLLFDAALEDQELFDQLAHEQALKELLEEPGAKQRLIAALEPEPSTPERAGSVFWANRWPWAIAAITASLAVVIGVAVLRTPEKPREIAAVTKQAEPPAPAVATPQVTPPVPQSAANAESRSNTSRPTVPKVSPAPPPAAATSDTPKAETSKANEPRIDQPKAEKTTQPSVDAVQEIVIAPPPPGVPAPAAAPPISNFVAGQTSQVTGVQVQPPPPPVPAPAGAVGGVAVIGGAAPRSADVAAGKGGRGGGGGGKGGGAIGFAAQNRAKAVAPRFAFDYSFDADGALRITPAAPGYLSVTVPTQPAPTVILPARNVAAAAPVIVPIPSGASELVVSFSATPAVTIGTPSRREEPTGTVEAADQSQRILVTIPVKR